MLQRKTLKQLHRDLSLSTRMYTLMAIVTVILASVFDAFSNDWALTIVSTIIIILFVESFAIYFSNHPKAWRTVRLILFLILLAMLLISAIIGF